MVTKWGLSPKLGPLVYSEEEGEVFLGHSVTQHKVVSDETAHLIDEEVRNIIDRNYERAHTILTENMDKLRLMAEALIKYETIDQDQIRPFSRTIDDLEAVEAALSRHGDIDRLAGQPGIADPLRQRGADDDDA